MMQQTGRQRKLSWQLLLPPFRTTLQASVICRLQFCMLTGRNMSAGLVLFWRRNMSISIYHLGLDLVALGVLSAAFKGLK